MIPVWWSFLLASVGIVGILATAQHRWWGFGLGIGAQALWVAYALFTGQPGFVLSALAYTCAYGYGAVKWMRASGEVSP